MSMVGQDEAIDTCAAPVSIVNEADSRRATWIAVILIAGAGGLAYLDSFQGAFVFDDRVLITDNPTIRHLWPPWRVMLDPLNVDRPLLGLSNAINYAISGLNPWSYHALNLLIHVLAALALFGIVRRTLAADSLAERFGKDSITLALAVALIWMVHPLQTQSVTYVIQRCESMMGMFYLVTLYCSIRGFHSNRKGLWYAAAVAACAGGMMSKQVMVTAPVVVLLYDFLFGAGSVREALRKRWPLYMGLAATWGILAATVIAAPVNPTLGFAVKSISPLNYLRSQLGVVIYYLRLSIWPSPLCLDYYGWPKSPGVATTAWQGIILAGLAATTAWAIYRRKPAAFIGAWFFLILSVTSSVLPIADLVFEHRMYLPLASVVALAVLGGYSVGQRMIDRLRVLIQLDQRVIGRAALALGSLVVLALGLSTARRNLDYESDVAMWSDVVNKRPDNARGQNNLGEALWYRGQWEAAAPRFLKSVEIDPDFPAGQMNLGMVLVQTGQIDDGIAHLTRATELDPQLVEAYNTLGTAYLRRGQFDEAIRCLNSALRINPRLPGALANLGLVLVQTGQIDDGIAHLNRATELDPQLVEAYNTLGAAYARKGQFGEAIRCLNAALRINPRLVGALENLGLILEDQGRLEEASSSLKSAIAYEPDLETAAKLHFVYADVLLKKGELAGAADQYREALRLNPGFSPASDALRRITKEASSKNR